MSSWNATPVAGYAPGIQGLRGLAILITAHSHVSRGPYAFTDPLGCVGVTVFFVLSGYNAMGSLSRLNHKLESTGGSWPRELLALHVNRWKRLQVSMIAMLASMWILNYFSENNRYEWPMMAHHSILAATYTQNIPALWLQEGNAGPFGNTWSLGATEQFHLLLSASAPWLLNQRQGHIHRLLLIAIITSFGLRFYASAYPTSGIDFHNNVLCNTWRFAVGALLRSPLPLPSLVFRSEAVYVGVFLILLTPYLYTFHGIKSYAYLFPGWEGVIRPMTLYGDVIVACGTCLILCGCRVVPTRSMTATAAESSPTSAQSTTRSRSPNLLPILKLDMHKDLHKAGPTQSANLLLECALFQHLGRVSYAFYLTQLPLLILSGWPRGWIGWGLEAMSLLLAQAITFWIEPPVKAWISSCRHVAIKLVD